MIIMYSAAQSIMSTATASVCATKVGKLDALQNDVHFLSAVFLFSASLEIMQRTKKKVPV